MQKDFGNSLSELDALTEVLEQFGKSHHLPAETVGALNLALDELFTNVVQHGYRADQNGKITLRLEMDGNAVLATLQDQAPPYNPFDAPEPDIESPLQSRPIGGLGVFLVKKLMDHWEYHREKENNTIILRKNLA